MFVICTGLFFHHCIVPLVILKCKYILYSQIKSESSNWIITMAFLSHSVHHRRDSSSGIMFGIADNNQLMIYRPVPCVYLFLLFSFNHRFLQLLWTLWPVLVQMQLSHCLLALLIQLLPFLVTVTPSLPPPDTVPSPQSKQVLASDIIQSRIKKKDS